MTPSCVLNGDALDYAVGIAVNGVYTPEKVDRRAAWFWPRTGIVPAGYSRRAPAFSVDPKWIPKLGRFAGRHVVLACNDGIWTAALANCEVATGGTLQIALCRAIVLREIGPIVQVPDGIKVRQEGTL